MLEVYTFMFSEMFNARWGSLGKPDPPSFAVNIFTELITLNLFAECINRAPGLILANSNYVKKVVFPLEILGGFAVGGTRFHALTSVLALVLFELIAFRNTPITFFWIQVVWLLLMLGCLALTWVLAALGVFLQDINQLVGALVSMLMFLSPVFFPMSAVPVQWYPLLSLNPLAQVIEQTRQVAVEGNIPAVCYLVGGTIIGGLACELSFRTFQKSKRAFADVK